MYHRGLLPPLFPVTWPAVEIMHTGIYSSGYSASAAEPNSEGQVLNVEKDLHWFHGSLLRFSGRSAYAVPHILRCSI